MVHKKKGWLAVKTAKENNTCIIFLEGEVSARNVPELQGELDEIMAAHPGEELVYRIIGEYGPAHDRHFEAEAVIGSKTLGRGHGSAKKSAEMEAAYRALIELKQRGIHVS